MKTSSVAVRVLAAATVVVLSIVGFAAPASAHDPIFITADQTTPDTGPYMPDGSISWALYGSVLDAGDTRGFEFDLRSGDELFVSLLIPNLAPEVDLTDAELPVIELEAPDGTTLVIEPEIRQVFDEPFSKTSYVTLAEHRAPAQAGRYRGLIVGNAPARFSVAIGETEIFFTETERSGDRPATFADITGPLTEWYTTPPGGEPSVDALAEGEAEIQLDLIEEAMDEGMADAPEEALADADEADEVDTGEPEAGEPEAGEPEPEEAEIAQEAGGDVADDGGGAAWVAPAVIVVIALGAAGVFAVRRRAA